MNFDGITLSSVTQELNRKIIGGIIRKIYQPERELILIKIWADEPFKLLFAASSNSRVHLTKLDFKNPKIPPAFCMLLRARLQGGVIRKITQRGLDRILDIHIQKRDKGFVLSLEPMGKYSNCILIEDKQTVDSLNRKRGKRTVLPGKKYQPPPGQEKHDPRIIKWDELSKIIKTNTEENQEIWKKIFSNIEGIGPRISKEIVIRAKIDPFKKLSKLSSKEINSLTTSFEEIFGHVKRGDWQPLVYYQDNQPVTWAPFELIMYKDLQKERKTSISQALDEYFEHWRSQKVFGEQLRRLTKVLINELERVKGAISSVKEEFEEAQKYDIYKKKADLLMANQAHIDNPGEKVRLADIFDSERPLIEINLDPSFSVVENANRYYRQYKKLKRAQVKLTRRKRELELERRYLLDLQSNVEQAESSHDLDQLEEELKDEGYLKSAGKRAKKERGKGGGPRKFKINGYQILVGKSGLQNDKLIREASKRDLWFHVRNMPGAHVIVKTGGDYQKLPEEVLYKVAQLAAYYSKGRSSKKVPVSHTQVKYLKKPKGAKPGLVICEKEDVMTVTPQIDFKEQSE